MRAVILAGGRGSRLAPFTTVIPKPLLPVGDMPILEVLLRQLVHAGFDHVTLTLGYMKSYFHTFLAEHRVLRSLAKIDVVEEDHPTGTAGSLASIPNLHGDFLVINGDILTNMDYRALMTYHRDRQAHLTIGLHQKDVKIDLGVITTDNQARVTNYVEKPTLAYGVSMGVYVYNEAALKYIQPKETLDFPSLVLRLIAQQCPVLAYPNQATWLDLGRFEDLERAADIFAQRRAEFLPDTARRVAS